MIQISITTENVGGGKRNIYMLSSCFKMLSQIFFSFFGICKPGALRLFCYQHISYVSFYLCSPQVTWSSHVQMIPVEVWWSFQWARTLSDYEKQFLSIGHKHLYELKTNFCSVKHVKNNLLLLIISLLILSIVFLLLLSNASFHLQIHKDVHAFEHMHTHVQKSAKHRKVWDTEIKFFFLHFDIVSFGIFLCISHSYISHS